MERKQEPRGKTMAVILAAGRGSRMDGLPDDVNKCAFPFRDGTSPLVHTVRSFAANGVTRFCVTVGHAAESVRHALGPAGDFADVTFVDNPLYAATGCNYSLARAVRSGLPDDVGRIVLIEGDSLLPAESIAQIVRSDTAASVLVRPASFVNPTRSVVALGREGKVSRFAYDPAHRDVFAADGPRDGEQVLGESMQIWSFGGVALTILKRLFLPFIENPESSIRAFLDRDLLSALDAAGAAMRPLCAERPDEWINMNTRRDVDKAAASAWLKVDF